MSDRPYHARVRVVRKSDPVPPEPYTCLICNETVTMAGTEWNWPHPEFRHGPVCQRCTHRWGYSNAYQRFHKDERRKVMKLAAVINALSWEVMNGNGRWKRGLRNAGH